MLLILILITEEEKKLSDEVYDEITNYLQIGAPAPRLFSLLEQIPMPNVFGYLSTAQALITEGSICIICRSVIDALLRYYDTRKSAEDLRSIVYQLCTQLQIQPDEVCAGVIDLNLVSNPNTNKFEGKFLQGKDKLIICALRNYNFRFQEKDSNLNQDSNLRPPDISSLVFYHLSYLGSIDRTLLNLSLESNAMQDVDDR